MPKKKEDKMSLEYLESKARELAEREEKLQKREEAVAQRERNVDGIIAALRRALSNKIMEKSQSGGDRKTHYRSTWLSTLHSSPFVIQGHKQPLALEWKQPSDSKPKPSTATTIKFRRDQRWFGGYCSMWRLFNRISCNLQKMHTDSENAYMSFATPEQTTRAIVLLKTRLSSGVTRVTDEEFSQSEASVGMSPISAWHWDPQSLLGEWFITGVDNNFETSSFTMAIHKIAPEQGIVTATLQKLRSQESNHVRGFFDRSKQMCGFNIKTSKSHDSHVFIKTCAGGHRLVGFCSATPLDGGIKHDVMCAQLDGVRKSRRKSDDRKNAWEIDVLPEDLDIFKQGSKPHSVAFPAEVPAVVAGHYGAFVRTGIFTYESLHNPGWSIGREIASDGYIPPEAKWILTDIVIGIKFTCDHLLGVFTCSDPTTEAITVTKARTTEPGIRCRCCFQPITYTMEVCPACSSQLMTNQSLPVFWLMTIPAYGIAYPVCTQGGAVLQLEICSHGGSLKTTQLKTSQGGWGSCFTIATKKNNITAQLCSQAHAGCDSLLVRGTLRDKNGLADFSLQQMPWGAHPSSTSIIRTLTDTLLSHANWTDHINSSAATSKPLPQPSPSTEISQTTSITESSKDESVISRIKGMLNEVSFSDDAFQEIIGPLLGPLVEKVKSEEGANGDPASMEVVSLALEAMKFSRGFERCDSNSSFSMSGSSVCRSADSFSDDSVDSTTSEIHYLNDDEVIERHYELLTTVADQHVINSRRDILAEFSDEMDKVEAIKKRNFTIFEEFMRKGEKKVVGLPTLSIVDDVKDDLYSDKSEAEDDQDLDDPAVKLVDWIEVLSGSVERSVAMSFIEGYSDPSRNASLKA
eukprot:TRINITY_DN10655_c0_g1_i1.p1 TRINITY_DN10655_c0_g1~~TRINITY_DN10655_c0_g1_i1.p1  ORF type:complete len:860 (+),score=131.27 TRINITY_DN10655_c0_g1_i1:97-2676(+)